ncbi:MAG: hypothetical protein ABSA80_13830 [Terriglobales bacterium]
MTVRLHHVALGEPAVFVLRLDVGKMHEEFVFIDKESICANKSGVKPGVGCLVAGLVLVPHSHRHRAGVDPICDILDADPVSRMRCLIPRASWRSLAARLFDLFHELLGQLGN